MERSGSRQRVPVQPSLQRPAAVADAEAQGEGVVHCAPRRMEDAYNNAAAAAKNAIKPAVDVRDKRLSGAGAPLGCSGGRECRRPTTAHTPEEDMLCGRCRDCCR